MGVCGGKEGLPPKCVWTSQGNAISFSESPSIHVATVSPCTMLVCAVIHAYII